MVNRNRVEIGQHIVSAEQGTHGCGNFWKATVDAINGEVATATITRSGNCATCGEFGAWTRQDELQGRRVEFRLADVHERPRFASEVVRWSFEA